MHVSACISAAVFRVLCAVMASFRHIDALNNEKKRNLKLCYIEVLLH